MRLIPLLAIDPGKRTGIFSGKASVREDLSDPFPPDFSNILAPTVPLADTANAATRYNGCEIEKLDGDLAS